MEAKFVHMSLELNVECPNEDCDEYFDLFKMSELIDEGLLYDLVCSTKGTYGNWGCEDFQKRLDEMGIEIHCPKCGTKIEIESVSW